MTTSSLFNSARLKISLYYVLTMMTISLSFSAILYRGATLELRRSLRSQAVRFFPRFDRLVPYSVVTEPDESVYIEARNRIAFSLFTLNGVILVFTSLASYVLAGKTLRPIEEMMEEQKRFVSDASHELRTPLTAMRTEIEVMLREKNIRASEARALLTSNLEEIDKMRSLSDYLLKLTHYDTGQTTLPMERLPLPALIASAVKRVQPLATAKHIEITQDVCALEITGNKISLIELLTILLENAIKYSQDGKPIVVAGYRTKKHTVLTVQDHGVGIRASELPYIFNRFYRAESSRNKRQVDGFGLGLSIAKTIVTAHGGKISVESEVGKGSTFKVLLSTHSH